MSGSCEEARPAREAWEVFARLKYEEPLRHIGTVTANDPELACVYARSIYNELPWIEMIAVPRRAIRKVIAA